MHVLQHTALVSDYKDALVAECMELYLLAEGLCPFGTFYHCIFYLARTTTMCVLDVPNFVTDPPLSFADRLSLHALSCTWRFERLRFMGSARDTLLKLPPKPSVRRFALCGQKGKPKAFHLTSDANFGECLSKHGRLYGVHQKSV